MANDDDKDILITPNVGATGFPNIQFKGYNADTDGDAITLNVLDDNTLSFESNQGQVFSINPILNTGTIFSVNDISGIASISVNADGTVAIAETGSPGKLGIGTTSPMNVMQVNVGTSSGAADGNNGIMIVNNDASLAADALIGGIGFDSVDGNVPSSVLESSAYVAAYAAEDHGASDKGGHIAFGTAAINQDDDTVTSERMRITSEGLVGVGTTAPSFTSGIGIEVSHATQANFRATDSNGASTDFATSGNDTYILNRHASGKVYIKPGNGDHSIELASNGQVKFNNAYTFPTSDGSANQVLQTNGSGTLSFATVSGGGSGISDIVEDTSPQLGGDLDTNSRNIKFDDAHGIYDDSNNEMLIFEKTASADSYIEVHNAITNSTSATLFGNDVVGSNTGSAPTSVGPGFAATGTNDNVALAFKTKGLGKFIFLNDDTTDSTGPTLNLMRKHSSEADNDNIGQILFQGMDSSPAGSDVEDLRDYAKVRARMIDVTDGTVDGQLRLSAIVNNSHKTLVEIGAHEDDDNAAGVSLWRGQMRDIGSNTTLDESDYAGRYLRVTGAYTVTLPASPAKGEQYIIISDHSGTTTISANGSDTMNGSTSNQTITTRYEAKTCIAVSTSAWIVLG